MAAATVVTETTDPSFVKLQLRTAYGPVYRDVLASPPREARNDEIPLIDIGRIYSDDLEDRKSLAREIKHAAENTGFFYIKNHGIPESAIDGALEASKSFFAQPEDEKQLVSKSKGKYYNGYSGNGTAMASPTEGRESLFSFFFISYPSAMTPDPLPYFYPLPTSACSLPSLQRFGCCPAACRKLRT